jgi:2-aminoadipate transaminase
MEQGLLEKHINELIPLYKHKRDVMLQAMDETLDKSYARWVKPKGGLFTWLTVENLDALALAEHAIEKHGVAVVPGPAFHLLSNEGTESMRINYSYPSDEQIQEGVKRLAEAIEGERKRFSKESPPPAI